jgi:CheY-like chemotaxis protein
MTRVLCVDDNPKIAGQVAEIFETWRNSPLGQLETSIETNFKKAVRRLMNERFDLVTLDLHADTDPNTTDTDSEPEWEAAQQGKHVLEELKRTRFVPVIFYSGYAEKIADLKSLVVRVVKKGSNDVQSVREAAQSLFSTGLPKLMRHIEEEQRSYIWDTVDAHSNWFRKEVDSDELLYLLARRIAAGLGRESIKALLDHPKDSSRPIELYIYPPLSGNIKTGCIYGPDDNGAYWIVATPSCDFAQGKARQIKCCCSARHPSQHTRNSPIGRRSTGRPKAIRHALPEPKTPTRN